MIKEMAKLSTLHKYKVEYAQFAVLKAQGVTSILVEDHIPFQSKG